MSGTDARGVIVAGMHRSGTSLTTRVLAEAGWHPGDEVLSSADERYLEDASFVALHRSWLETCLPAGRGHADWGVSAAGVVDLASRSSAVAAEHSAAARAFVERRSAAGERWVAKDPRATLFLPVWAEIDSPRFVLVYRNPWDVVDSAVRLGSDVFCRRPRLALHAWLDHNQRLADFATAHRDRCVVIAAEMITLDPAQVQAALHGFLGAEVPAPSSLLDPARFVRRDDAHPIAALYRDVHPDLCAVLDRLDDLADVARRPVPARRPRVTAAGGTLPPGTGVQVIVPCRDDGDFVLEAIASVDDCALTVADGGRDSLIELTVVDDGSTDAETVRILDALRGSGRHVVTTSGIGLAAARNAGLATSSTLAVIPLDADNRLRPPLVEGLALLVAGDADIVHGPWVRFGMERRVVEPPPIALESLVPSNTVDACALIRRDLLERLGGWDAGLRFWEDWDLWLGAVGAGARVHRLDAPSFEYLVRPDSLSSVPTADHEARAGAVERIVARHTTLLGPVVSRLVVRIHQCDTVRVAALTAKKWLDVAHDDLRTRHRHLAQEHHDLAQRHQELAQRHHDLAAQLAAAEAELAATRRRTVVVAADSLAGTLAHHRWLARAVAPVRRLVGRLVRSTVRHPQEDL